MENTAKGLYEQLTTEREHFLIRARRASELTIPSVMPLNGSNSSTEYVDPYQSIGARGVNNLASKLHLALLPPTGPFFRFSIPEGMKAELEETDAAQEIQAALSQIELDIMRELEARGIRSRGATIFRHLLVTGNVLLDIPKDEPAKLHFLDQFVVERDGNDHLMYVVVKESINPLFLPDEVRHAAPPDGQEEPVGVSGPRRRDVDLYTAAERTGRDSFRVYQEVHGIRFNETENVKEENLQFIPLRWSEKDGEDYGRGFVDEYIGDLTSLEGLRTAVVQASAAGAKVVWLVRPNGTTSARALTKARNGDFVSGHEEDIGRLTLEKQTDLGVAASQIESITDDLRHAFLLHTSIQRNGERVTAEEIRFMAQELEDALGGAYSVLASGFQRKLVERLRGLVSLDAGAKRVLKRLNLTITTGIEALGRGHELNRLDIFLSGAGQLLGAEVVAQYISPSVYLARRAAALNIDVSDLVRSEEEVQQATQAAQMAELGQNVAPEVVRQVGQSAQAQQARG